MAEENKAMELHGEESEKKKYISDVLDIDKLMKHWYALMLRKQLL